MEADVILGAIVLAVRSVVKVLLMERDDVAFKLVVPEEVMPPVVSPMVLAASVVVPVPEIVPVTFIVLAELVRLSVLPVAIEEVPSERVEAEPVRVTL